MPENILQIEGKLTPLPTGDYPDISINLPSFSITVTKEQVVAIPHTDIPSEETNTTIEILQHQITPILTVYGSMEGRTITLEITDVKYPTLKRFSTSILITYTIERPAQIMKEIQKKVQWAYTDTVYCDLLDVYTEALAAPNPRPTGYKMIERLEKKFGTRQNACNVLGISKNSLDPIVADQWKYQGDRHAKYEMDEIPARLISAERNELLTLLNHIIQAYEKFVDRIQPESK